MAIKPEAPCKDCPDRTTRCHCTCSKYLSFRKELDKWNAEYRKQKRLEFDSRIYEAAIRSRKRRMR